MLLVRDVLPARKAGRFWITSNRLLARSGQGVAA
jgi:hypothetical protein